MCSPRRKPENGDIILSDLFYLEQEKGQHRTQTKFEWALPGAT